jgi:hypothetical protein
MSVFQDAMDAISGRKRQAALTGNEKAGVRQEEALYNAYFDTMQKRSQYSQDLALRNRGLDIQQQSANTAASQSDWQKDVYNKALGQQNLWQGIGAGAQALGLGLGAWQKQQALNKANPLTTPIEQPNQYNATTLRDYSYLSPKAQYLQENAIGTTNDPYGLTGENAPTNTYAPRADIPADAPVFTFNKGDYGGIFDWSFSFD